MFRVLLLYEHEHMDKFSNLHQRTFKNEDKTTTCAVYLKLCQKTQSSANDGLVVL